MDWMACLKKAFGTGILCCVGYHGTLLLIGQPFSVTTVLVFIAIFTALDFLWLMLVSAGRKK